MIISLKERAFQHMRQITLLYYRKKERKKENTSHILISLQNVALLLLFLYRSDMSSITIRLVVMDMMLSLIRMLTLRPPIYTHFEREYWYEKISAVHARGSIKKSSTIAFETNAILYTGIKTCC